MCSDFKKKICKIISILYCPKPVFCQHNDHGKIVIYCVLALN